MPKPLIEYVQDILSSMDSDEVNSISDTVESMQVATILKNCYEELVANIELPEEYTLFHLDSSSDVSKLISCSYSHLMCNFHGIFSSLC